MSQALLTEAGFPPEDAVFDVSSFDLRVIGGAHPWVDENAAAIERNWRSEIAANPRLFNGMMVFQRRLAFDAGHIEGTAHLVPYAAFLHWRRTGRAGGGYHLFAAPMIFSADGALMAIRMAGTTANPGRVYAPAGSLDGSDVRNGLCDLEGNMVRETMEETGLDLRTMAAEPGWRAVHAANTVAVFRIFRSALAEAELGERAAAHIAAEAEPEISALVGIRSADPAAHDYAPFMLPVLDWIFRKGMK